MLRRAPLEGSQLAIASACGAAAVVACTAATQPSLPMDVAQTEAGQLTVSKAVGCGVQVASGDDNVLATTVRFDEGGQLHGLAIADGLRAGGYAFRWTCGATLRVTKVDAGGEVDREYIVLFSGQAHPIYGSKNW